ncbi:hypothetical protein QMZ05_33545, partial [Bradyrhizobium sp. INPA03-11B]|uniref:hypothetical protein n=1 Tax=Bradyrhizobium sp. INPA03-11B TaxID=418598 RepID=UPI00338FE20E
DQWTHSEILRQGVTTTAHIFSIKYNAGALSNPYYVVELMWDDKSGATRTYRTSLSIDFVGSITSKDNAIKKYLPIKYLEENSYARPLVMGDERERDRIVSNDTRWGVGLFASSLALIALLLWVRRKEAVKEHPFAATRSPL